MALRNNLERWGSVARFFHWTIALLIFGLFVVGFVMEDLGGENRRLAYNLHKSFGILVLALVVCRLIWRMGSVVPTPPASSLRWQVLLAELVHWGLYAAMLLVPVTGYLATSFGHYPFNLFMIEGARVPLLVGENKPLGEMISNVHAGAAFAFLGLLVLHIGAALYHHFIAKDAVLARMTPFVTVPKK